MKYFYLLSLFFLIGCSQNNSNSYSPKDFGDKNTNIEALASFTDTSTADPNFGNPVTTSTTRIFTFKNTGTTAGPAGVSLTGPEAYAYSIILQTGCANVNVGSTCAVRVNFNPSGKVYGTYIASLTVGEVVKNLSATTSAPNSGTTGSSSAIISMLEGSSEITVPVDFGVVTGTQSVTKIITIKNTGTASTGPHTALLSNSNYSFLLNGCSNKTLIPNGSCQVRVRLAASGQTPGVKEGVLSFSTSSVNLTGEVIQSYTLTVANNARVNINDGSSLNCGAGSSVCSRLYNSGSTVTLTAAPITGYQVSSWTLPGSCSLLTSDSASCILSSNLNVSAPSLSCASGYSLQSGFCVSSVLTRTWELNPNINYIDFVNNGYPSKTFKQSDGSYLIINYNDSSEELIVRTLDSSLNLLNIYEGSLPGFQSFHSNLVTELQGEFFKIGGTYDINFARLFNNKLEISAFVRGNTSDFSFSQEGLIRIKMNIINSSPNKTLTLDSSFGDNGTILSFFKNTTNLGSFNTYVKNNKFLIHGYIGLRESGAIPEYESDHSYQGFLAVFNLDGTLASEYTKSPYVVTDPLIGNRSSVFFEYLNPTTYQSPHPGFFIFESYHSQNPIVSIVADEFVRKTVPEWQPEVEDLILNEDGSIEALVSVTVQNDPFCLTNPSCEGYGYESMRIYKFGPQGELVDAKKLFSQGQDYFSTDARKFVKDNNKYYILSYSIPEVSVFNSSGDFLSSLPLSGNPFGDPYYYSSMLINNNKLILAANDSSNGQSWDDNGLYLESNRLDGSEGSLAFVKQLTLLSGPPQFSQNFFFNTNGSLTIFGNSSSGTRIFQIR